MTSRERLDLQNCLFESLLTYNHHSEGIMRIRVGRSCHGRAIILLDLLPGQFGIFDT